MIADAGGNNLALIVPGETDYLRLIRDFVTAVARKMGFPENRVGEIEIAVDEACANIMEHAYGAAAITGRLMVAHSPGSDTPAIVLRVAAFSDRIEVKILDHGPNFALDRFSSPPLTEFVSGDRKRGMGTYIIRNFMDEVRHAYRPGDGNELTLVKYLATA